MSFKNLYHSICLYILQLHFPTKDQSIVSAQFEWGSVMHCVRNSYNNVAKKQGRGKVGGKRKPKRKIYYVTQKEGMKLREKTKIVIDENS